MNTSAWDEITAAAECLGIFPRQVVPLAQLVSFRQDTARQLGG